MRESKRSRDRASRSPERRRRSEVGDNEVSLNAELESPRNSRCSNSPDLLRSHSRASFKQTSRSPDYRSVASSRKSSRSFSPESLNSKSGRNSYISNSRKEKGAATERELLLEKWR